MTEVSFYKLTTQPLDQALPRLLATIRDRGLRVLVQGQDADALARLDVRLWTFDDQAFLAHGRAEGSDRDRAQPILLADNSENRNLAEVLLLVAGARYDAAQCEGYDRVCLMFDGNDMEATAQARDDWRAVTGGGAQAIYWAQDGGRWVKQAESQAS